MKQPRPADDDHGVPGPSLGVPRTASSNTMALRLSGFVGWAVQAAAELDRYYTAAAALGATEEQARAALCGTLAPTEQDRDAALRRFKDGSAPMSEALRETVQHLVSASPRSFADIAGAVEVLSTRTIANPSFTPWTDDQLVQGLPALVDMAAAGPETVRRVALMLRAASA